MIQKILDNLWGSAIFTVNVGFGFTDILKKNCYLKIQEKLKKPASKKNTQLTNQRSRGESYNNDFSEPFVYWGPTYKGNRTISVIFVFWIYFWVILISLCCIPYHTMFNCVIQSRVSQISAKIMKFYFHVEAYS